MPGCVVGRTRRHYLVLAAGSVARFWNCGCRGISFTSAKYHAASEDGRAKEQDATKAAEAVLKADEEARRRRRGGPRGPPRYPGLPPALPPLYLVLTLLTAYRLGLWTRLEWSAPRTGRVPSAPSAERRAPSAERRAPSAERSERPGGTDRSTLPGGRGHRGAGAGPRGHQQRRAAVARGPVWLAPQQAVGARGRALHLYPARPVHAAPLPPREDDPVLEHALDDGQRVEPRLIVPVIPMVLVNGAAGIGTKSQT